MTEELKAKVDTLTSAVTDLKIESALMKQHVANHERLVSEFMARNDERMEAMDRQIDKGFEQARADNAAQMAILAKWGTIRDTLVWVSGVLLVVVAGLWTVFTWTTGRIWPSK